MLSLFQRHASASSIGSPADNGDDNRRHKPLHQDKLSMTNMDPFTAMDLFNPLGPNLLSLLPENSVPSPTSSQLSPNNASSKLPWIVIKPTTLHRRDESTLLTEEEDISSLDDDDNGEWYVHCSRSRSYSNHSNNGKKSHVVAFCPAVEIMEIPSHRDYDEATRERLWVTPEEREADKTRNMMEFLVDGWDWRRATEEHCFVRLPGDEGGDEYELVHPATWMQRMMVMDSESDQTKSQRRRQRRRRITSKKQRIPFTSWSRRVRITAPERPPTRITTTCDYNVYLGDHHHSSYGSLCPKNNDSSPAVLLPPSAKHRFAGKHFDRHF